MKILICDAESKTLYVSQDDEDELTVEPGDTIEIAERNGEFVLTEAVDMRGAGIRLEFEGMPAHVYGDKFDALYIVRPVWIAAGVGRSH